MARESKEVKSTLPRRIGKSKEARSVRARPVRESKEAKSVRARRIVELLERAMPEAKIALEYQDELQLLVAVMLSAQTTDALVNTVTPALFAKYRTAEDYAKASESELQRMIQRIGLFRTKAKNLRGAMARIAREHGGKLPRTREELYELPGVGWKTAGVVVNHAFGTPALPVDTHVGRVSRRLGLTKEEDPDRVEGDLSALLPPETWGRAHQLLIWHGRRTCLARRPRCSVCPVAELCPRVGVTSSA
jgi:endonuclease-3